MVDAHIGFLYKAASTLMQTETERTQSILRSYYLMRCMQITKGYGLPVKHFSSQTRCPHCCIEWGKNCETKIKSFKLSKRQKKRIKSRKSIKDSVDRKAISHSNELERICSFCKHSTVTPILKPTKVAVASIQKENATEIKTNKSNVSKSNVNKTKVKLSIEKKTETSIYYNAKEVFSLNNKNNALANTKETKVLKNNKRKKDKFAGLCQQAVLTSAKLKEAKSKNKLLSFLKSSS